VLRISVRDFGEGIDPIYIPRLTERFTVSTGAARATAAARGWGWRLSNTS
jgi:signal transduction histidine kinase